MLMQRVRVTLDRKTGKVVTSENMNTEELRNEDLGRSAAILITGMSLDDCAKEIEKI